MASLEVRGKAVKVLGLSFVRNAESRLAGCLDAMAVYCDDICIVDDRSNDDTSNLARSHPAVSNVFTIDSKISPNPWHIPECLLLDVLYRMADVCRPDWIVMLSDDERIVGSDGFREKLSTANADTPALQTHLVSSWNDPEYPHMVPVMGQARSSVTRIWRYRPGLQPARKRLHNSYCPVNIAEFGRVEFRDDITISHAGWSTLARRIAKVDIYRSLDPNDELNDGVPYDVGLLFGYRRDRITELISEYHRRIALIRGGMCGSP